MSRTRALRLWLAVAFTAAGGVAACGGGAAPSPFSNGDDAGAAGDVNNEAGSGSGGRPQIDDPTLGGPCVDDGQCDDGVECTDDSCLPSIGRCRYLPQHDRCADELYCNGIEVCEPKVGCRAGDPVTCSDGSSCTIDRCDEATRSCERSARDADGDGDPVWNCGGGDCDDSDPNVNSRRNEICGNHVDDDCDQEVDESDCAAPEHDTCADALEVSGPGTFELSLLAASEDIAVACVKETSGTRRDVVLALQVPEGPPQDVVVTAISPDKGLALASFESCGKGAVALACSSAVELPRSADGNVARVWLRGLEPGAYPLFVSGVSDDSVALSVDFREASSPPENETCGTARELTAESSVVAELVSVRDDVTSACDASAGELFYRIELSEPQDVTLRALPLDGNGVPSLSLRSERCSSAQLANSGELDCRSGAPAHLFARALPAGTYFVAVAASGPSEVEVSVLLEPPSERRPGEGCANAAELAGNFTVTADLLNGTNSIASACLAGGVDVTYALQLEERADVLLVERLSEGDIGAVSLLDASCAVDAALSCVVSGRSPVRARSFAVRPGDYRVVAESALGAPVAVTAFTRPAQPSTLVLLADSCADAVPIPATGGRFSGNTNQAFPDFDAGCDYGGVPAGGAPDQLLSLHLDEPRRVILDMSGSDYETLLDVRKVDVPGACPGVEVAKACAPGRIRGSDRSFLDLTLEAGDYYVQIDGFGGAAGHWILDVYLSSP